MSGFDELKLDDDLLEHLRALGYRQPTALQSEAIPVIARGTTAVGVASAGSGKTLAYGLGLAARLDPAGPGPQALVLRPTDDRAVACAEALQRLLRPRALTVAAVQPRGPTAAHVAAASPSAALAAVEHSAIKLQGLRAVVFDGASAMLGLGAAGALETLTAQIPKDAQRILLTAELNRDVEDWLDRHARRARRLTYIPAEAPPLAHVTVEFHAAPTATWMPVLAGLLSGASAKAGGWGLVHCRFEQEARQLADRIAVRGIPCRVGPESEVTSVVAWGTGSPSAAYSVSWGSPPDVVSFQQRFASAARAIAFLEPREFPHLQRLASALSVRLSPLKIAVPPDAQSSVQLTREQIREALAQRDLEPYVLILEPLLEEFNPIQLAAAATALFRELRPAAPPQPLPAWTRLYFGVGRRDGVRPADLVGAITGETAVTGDRIGRIEIRDTYSSVEVAASVADRVIKGLATTTIRGRPANVRVFRE